MEDVETFGLAPVSAGDKKGPGDDDGGGTVVEVFDTLLAASAGVQDAAPEFDSAAPEVASHT